MHPTATEINQKILHQKGREPIDKEKLAQIFAHKDRTHTNYRQLIEGWNNKPDGMDSNIIRHWGRGVHTAIIGWVDAVLRRYETLPDYEPPAPKLQKVKTRGEMVAFTAEMHQEILFHKKRTGISLPHFARSLGQEPIAISMSLLHTWVNRRVKYTQKEKLEYFLEKLRALPDLEVPTLPPRPIVKQKFPTRPKREKIEYHPITDEMIQSIQSEIDRTGMQPSTVLKRVGKNIPKGFTPNTVSRWVSKINKTLNIEHYNFLISSYKIIPSLK